MRYSIYAEGYSMIGQRGKAEFICSSEGRTFKDACINARNNGKFAGYGSFDENSLSLWGCNLFPSLQEAQESFG